MLLNKIIEWLKTTCLNDERNAMMSYEYERLSNQIHNGGYELLEMEIIAKMYLVNCM